MFGYLIASASTLTEDEIKRYKATYCGLCRCIGENHGEMSRLTLNYDMTFLVLLLESLYDCEEECGAKRCLAHPREKREYWQSEITRYAADMQIILSYFKLLDDWKDDKSLGALTASKMLEREALSLKEKYPRQYMAVENGIGRLAQLETSNSEDADSAAASFGAIMGELFVYKDDRWQKYLYNMGDALGRFIYLVDAAVDLDKDKRKGDYNPFMKYYGRPDNAESFKIILKLFLADAVNCFEKLPLIDDVGIMKNILCSGLWAKFEEKYGSIQSAGSESRRDG